ncbi:MAG: asparagine synthase-related protein [Thermodesulfobacteriota bacterium]
MQPPEILYERAGRSLFLLPGDRHRIRIRTPGMVLGTKSYDSYPVTIMEDDDFNMVLEGRIYDLPRCDLQKTLAGVVRQVFIAPPDHSSLGHRLHEMDGDFILFMHEKRSGKTAVLNDLFGRLPLYYRCGKTGFALSRDARFLYSLWNGLSVDRLSLAHFLMLGHALEEKTVFREIRLLTPASLLQVDPLERQVTVRRLHRFDFSQRDSEHESGDRKADRLVEGFIAACKARAGGDACHVVSLSGGLDSRAVAAGLHAAGSPFVTATFFRAGYTPDSETACARRVAQSLGAPWNLISLQPLRCRDARELLYLKAGFSPLYMAFILEYFRELRRRYGGDIVQFTGDGGDQCLPALRPPVPMTGLPGLADYIVQDNYLGGRRLGMKLTTALTGIPEATLLNSLVEYLEALPEKSLEAKWLHWQFYGIGVKICFEAEDRNRCYFWSASPFYSLPFYSDAIHCPQSRKSGFDLYRRFLQRLSPATAALEYSGYQGPLGSARFRLNHWKKRIKFIRPAWTLNLKHLLKGAEALPAGAPLFGMMAREGAMHPILREVIDFGQLQRIIAGGNRHDRYHMIHLFTALAMLGLGLYGDSVMDRHPDVLLL